MSQSSTLRSLDVDASPVGSLEALFQPFKLKSLTLRNRLVMAPMGRNASVRGMIRSFIAAISVAASKAALRCA
jgi:2,4-dienoyl-CoA reductase-like NADH-dependent reductase (Old Yellow Enzyme family)